MLRSSKTAKAGWRSAWQGRSIHFAKSHVGMALQVRACMRACVRGCVRAAGAARPSVLRRVTCGPTSSPISPFPAMSLFPPCIYAFVLAAPSLRSPPPYPHPYHPSIHPLLFGPPLSPPPLFLALLPHLPLLHPSSLAPPARQAYQDPLLDADGLSRVCIAAAADFRRVWARYGGRHAGRNLGKALKHLNSGGIAWGR